MATETWRKACATSAEFCAVELDIDGTATAAQTRSRYDVPIDDYDRVAARYLDEPHDRGLLEELLVYGDAIDTLGSPRGTLIALGHAIRTCHDVRRRHAIQAAMDAHVVAHGAMLLGELATILAVPRALVLEWRAGQLHGARLDTRYLGRALGHTPRELVAMLLAAPVAAELRRLYVRVSAPGQITDVLAALAGDAAPRLEELQIMRDLRPRRAHHHGPPGELGKPGARPHLGVVALDDELLALPLPATLDAGRLRRADPAQRDDRALLARSLIARDDTLRAAAVARLAEVGPRALVCLDTLMVLLLPRLSGVQAALIDVIRGLGAHGEPALDQLASITGLANTYDEATRRAAGAACVAIRAAIARV